MADAVIPHLLVIPFPSQGHILPLLDLCHLLSTRSNIKITIAITPGNLPTLSPLLSSSSNNNNMISPLLLPFPSSSSSSLPPGAENTHQLPPHLFPHLLTSLSSLLPPLLQWSHSHPNPPTAILSDFFTSAWTLPLSQSLSIPRISFSPSGAFALSTIHHLWRHLPPNTNPSLLIPFPSLPNSPSFPLSHLSTLYRTHTSLPDPIPQQIKQNFLSDARSWGFVLNTFSDLESGYIQHLTNHVPRVWAVGPLVTPALDRNSDPALKKEVMDWLDAFPDGTTTVVYVCFGSQAFLSPAQAAAISAALEVSGVRFLWCVRDGTEVPSGFEERVKGRGFVAKGWAPQVEVLGHKAVGWFMTHCGWNSVIEAVVAGVALLMWPRGADQFVDARLMEEAGMGVRVAEGMEAVPEVGEMARILEEAVMRGGGADGERKRAAELREVARKAVAEGGTSFRDLESLLAELKILALAQKLPHADSPELR